MIQGIVPVPWWLREFVVALLLAERRFSRPLEHISARIIGVRSILDAKQRGTLDFERQTPKHGAVSGVREGRRRKEIELGGGGG